jgi:AraC-like DNA-binding protein
MMSRTLGAPFGGTTRGGQNGVDWEAVSLITPPKGRGGGGSWAPSIVIVGAGSLTRDSVCRALGLNAGTLAHRLEAFGVTFSGLADEVRFDAAQSLLLKDRRVGEIAAELGFAEPSAFIRAFKSWSGTTPARGRAARNGPRM